MAMELEELGEDPLARGLLPVLVQRLRRATRELESAREGGLGGTALARAERTCAELAWVFGVVSLGLGADLLLERHEEGGLGPTLDCVAEGLSLESVELRIEGTPPRLVPTAAGGVESARLAWGLASLCWAGAPRPPARSSSGAASPMELSFTPPGARGVPGAGWSVEARVVPEVRDTPALEAAARRVGERLPGMEIGTWKSGWSARLPGPWCRAETP